MSDQLGHICSVVYDEPLHTVLGQASCSSHMPSARCQELQHQASTRTPPLQAWPQAAGVQEHQNDGVPMAPLRAHSPSGEHPGGWDSKGLESRKEGTPSQRSVGLRSL